jgi:predicted N-acetyltransferase YhbS
MDILYQIENDLSVEEFRDVLIRSSLGERRPVDDLEKLRKMCQHGNLIITARHNGRLVGVSRSLSDFAHSTYLADLAVDKEYQRKGIGKRLIYETKKAAPDTTITLVAAPDAIPYYPKTGMTKYEHCFRLKDIDDLNLGV